MDQIGQTIQKGYSDYQKRRIADRREVAYKLKERCTSDPESLTYNEARFVLQALMEQSILNKTQEHIDLTNKFMMKGGTAALGSIVFASTPYLLREFYNLSSGIKRLTWVSLFLASYAAQIWNGGASKGFHFKQVLDQKLSQRQVYDAVGAEDLVEKCVNGFHAAILTYGQTGTGKTYTIDGATNKDHREGLKMETDNDTSSIPETAGITERCLQALFRLIAVRENQRAYAVTLTYLQIHQEKLYDLLDTKSKEQIKLRWNLHSQFYVQGAMEVQCRNSSEALRWFSVGRANKKVAAHRFNHQSSRSHSVLIVKVMSMPIEGAGDRVEAKFQIVDLAGSERLRDLSLEGLTLQESVAINKSLFTLRHVIKALENGEKEGIQPPFRDSKLTSILKQSLGGNGFCSMIACISLAPQFEDETVQTLTYASMASKVTNRPVLNVDPQVLANKSLKAQNEQLRQEIDRMGKQIQRLEALLLAKGSQHPQRKTQTEILLLSSATHSQKQIFSTQQTGKASEPENDFASVKPAQVASEHFNTALSMSSQPMLITQSPIPHSNPKQTMMTVLHSIQAVKGLIQSNNQLRREVESMKLSCEGHARELYFLMNENTRLKECLLLQLESKGAKPSNDKQSRSTERSKMRHRIVSHEKTRRTISDAPEDTFFRNKSVSSKLTSGIGAVSEVQQHPFDNIMPSELSYNRFLMKPNKSRNQKLKAMSRYSFQPVLQRANYI